MLTQARFVWRTAEVLQGAIMAACAIMGSALVLFWADNLLELAVWLRTILAVFWAGGALYLLWRYVMHPWQKPMPRSAVARAIETHLGLKDNLLINTVQLTEDAPRGVSRNMVRSLVKAATAAGEGRSLTNLWPRKQLIRLAIGALAVLAIWGVYALALPEYAGNALSRYTSPFGNTPPLADFVFEVTPGDVDLRQGDTMDLVVVIRPREGQPDLWPEEVSLVMKTIGKTRQISLGAPDAGACRYRFSEVMEDFRYRIEADESQSRLYQVHVKKPVPIKQVRFEITPPTYTHAEKEVFYGEQEIIRALKGSRITVIATPEKEVTSGFLQLNPGSQTAMHASGEQWEAAFDLIENGEAAIFFEAPGADALPSLNFRIVPAFDQPPSVQFEDVPSNQMIAPGGKLVLPLKAEDDWGVGALEILISQEGAEREPCKIWTYVLPGHKSAKEIYQLAVDPARFHPGETYLVQGAAQDHNPFAKNRSTTPPILLRVAGVDEVALPGGGSLSAILERLKQLIEHQGQTSDKGNSLMLHFEEHQEKRQYAKRLNQVIREQKSRRSEGRQLAKRMNELETSKALSEKLNPIVSRDMDEAVGLLSGSATGRFSAATMPSKLPQAVDKQKEILENLTALLGEVLTIARTDEEDESAQEEEDELSDESREILSEFAKKLDEFAQAQTKIIKDTQELESIPQDDWTEGDQKLLGELADQESEWAKFFQEAFTDLSRVPEQDFASSELLKEVNQVYMEIQRAAEALYAETEEIAVPHEQAGLELADSIENNLERWIPDTPDYQKWVMEEPPEDMDVPLADLPDELEDIIGDLLDEEESMSEDVEDVSSSWMDSLDAGAGWDAQDGPISNMSAKGVTSNRLPNQNEVGGRSGEGRSGKSHGQFVEETAEGKGGRDTPTRLTQDPYEQGSVKDMSNERASGATGGGKLAGQGGAGLEGVPPPEVAAKMERMAGNQADIRQNAEAAAKWLRAYNLPAGDLEASINEMKRMETHLQEGRGFDLRKSHAQIKEGLSSSRQALQIQAAIHREKGAHMPKWVRSEILSGTLEEPPSNIEALLNAYYEAIARGEEAK